VRAGRRRSASESLAGRISLLNGWPRAALGEDLGPLWLPWAVHRGELDGDDGIAHFGRLVEFVMRTSPSIAPHGPGQDTYLVLDDFGRIGRAWRETDENATDRETLIRDLVEGEFSNPVRIVAFNIAEGWCRDVTVDIADELRRRVVEYGEISQSAIQFMQANHR